MGRLGKRRLIRRVIWLLLVMMMNAFIRLSMRLMAALFGLTLLWGVALTW